MTTQETRELGPFIAGALIAVGLAAIVWAVATKERVDEPGPKLTLTTGGPPPVVEEEPSGDGVSDAEWEAVLVAVEKLKTGGLVQKLDTEAQVATVGKDGWAALDDAKKREIGRQLAIYCGRVSGSDQHKVVIKDEGAHELGSYTLED